MKATKNTKAKAKKLEPQPTVGEYINERLNSRACNGDFGGGFGISTACAARDALEEYIEKFRVVRY